MEIDISKRVDRETASEIIGEATYINYRYNRARTPNVTPEEWAVVFGNTNDMEQRYQLELKEMQDGKNH